MRYTRGNIESERQKLEGAFFEIGLKGLTADRLKATFEKLGDYPKPKPQPVGRPHKTVAERINDQLKKDKSIGQTILFKSE